MMTPSDRQTGAIRRAWEWVVSWMGFFSRNHPVVFFTLLIVALAALAWGMLHVATLFAPIEYVLVVLLLLLLLLESYGMMTGRNDVY